MVLAALSLILPISAILPSLTATSAWRRSAPVPSITVPFLISKSYAIARSPSGAVVHRKRERRTCRMRIGNRRVRSDLKLGRLGGKRRRRRALAATPAQRPFLDAVPGEPRRRQGDGERSD